jgi:TetR/AcrR family transcriptional regulator
MSKKQAAKQIASITKTRRERERSARRQEILRIAREVFSEKSFYQATLEEIAEKAEFAKGTIYGYFSSKEDLFETLITEELDLMENGIRDALKEGSNPVEKLRAFIGYMFRYFTERNEFMCIYLSHIGRLVGQHAASFQITFTKRHKRMIEFMTDFLKQSQKEGYFTRVRGMTGAYELQGIIHAAVLAWLMSGQSYDLNDTVEPLLDFIIHGAGVPSE